MTLIAVLAGMVACSMGDPARPTSGAVDTTPTYHRDVAPILERRCVKCHNEQGIAPFALTTFEMARAMAPALSVEVGAGRMPPWGAHDTAECVPPLPWRDDERLSTSEIVTLQRWDASGAPEGHLDDAPHETVPVQSLELTTPTFELAPHASFTPSGSSSDEFRCFVLEAPELQAGGYVSAINVIPGSRKIVHHVTLYTDIGGKASLRAGADGSFDCANGLVAEPLDGVAPTLAWLLAWAPGGRPLELPSNVGIHIPPASKVVMEIHYSGRVVEPDLTRIQVTLADAKPEYTLSSWAIGNYGYPMEAGDGLQPGLEDRNGTTEFHVPANARAHAESMQMTLGFDGPLRIYGFRPHAHLAATDVKIDVIRDGVSECMVQDRWDFHWQRLYSFDTPIELLPTLNRGDKVKVRCTYDNSMMNRRLSQELVERELQPMDIELGNRSLDEMCLGEVLYIQKTP